MGQVDDFKDLVDDLTSLASNKSFDFLNDEEDLYTLDDLKEVYSK